jgi:hypothetical protein
MKKLRAVKQEGQREGKYERWGRNTQREIGLHGPSLQPRSLWKGKRGGRPHKG